jgi:hypothetical protein
MKWRVMLELVGPDGTIGIHEVGGRAAVAEYAPQMIGMTLAEGKRVLAALQVHLVQAQAEDHCRRRRRCQRCGAQRPLKDQRSRRLVSLFGTVKVRAPRFAPCRCAVSGRGTLSPVAEIMPDRCMPEYERVAPWPNSSCARLVSSVDAGSARRSGGQELRRERHAQPRPRRRRALRPPAVSACGLTTPTFWTVSGWCAEWDAGWAECDAAHLVW